MTVVLAAGGRRAVARAAAGIDWSAARWVYFGPGRAPDGLPADRQIDAREALDRACLALRAPYIHWVGTLPMAHAPEWASGAVAEKNPYISRAFLYAAVADVCCGLARDPAPLLVVAPDDGLRETLREVLSGRIRRSAGDEWPMRVARSLAGLTRRAGNLIRYGARHAGRVFLARYRHRLHRADAVRAAHGHAQVVTTQAWLDRRGVDLETGAFRDADFGEVATALAARGAHPLVVPVVLADARYARVAAYVARSGAPCLMPHAFLRLRDVFVAVAREAVRGPFAVSAGLPPFRGRAMTAAVARDLQEEWLGARRLDHAIQETWVRRVAEDGIRIARAIYTFENHAWERAFVVAMRRWHAGVRLVAHQPNGLPMMLLNYFIDPAEQDAAWLPDAIVTNGPYATRALIDGGFGAARVRAGGGLRQPHVRRWLAAPWQAPASHALPRVLVTPSIGLAATRELIAKCVAAFAGRTDCEVLIKLHPNVPAADAVAPWPSGLPAPFRLVTEPLGQWLDRVDMLIYNDGTFPAAEALAAGVPVCSVDLDFGVPLDAIDAFPDVNLRVRTPEALAAAVDECLRRDPARRRAFADRARQVAGELVGPVDATVLSAFADA